MKPYQDGYTPQARDIHHRASAALLVALGPLSDKIAQGLAEALLCMAVDIFEKYPGTQVEKVIWSRLMMEASPDTVSSYTNLMARLHHLEIHPDYEYVVLPESMSAEPNVPKGHSWEINPHYSPVYPGDTGWYRLKEDAKKDDIDPLSLPAIVIPKMSVQDYLGYLRETIVKGYMPSAQRDGHMSKPYYKTQPNSVAELYDGSGIYQYDWGMTVVHPCQFGALHIQEKELYCGLELGSFQVITRLREDPENSTFYRVQRADGTWQEYVHWPNTPDHLLPINPDKLKEQLELL